MGLNTLAPAEGAKHRRKIVGRGESSGHGKTSTRGHKGQKARSGDGKMSWFEGGQMSIVRRTPKRGFSHAMFRKEYEIVNLSTIESKFDAGAEITKEALKKAGIIKKDGLVKVLAKGDVKKNFVVKADAFSKTAKEKIEKAGGKAEIVK
ncbi:MAG: 50S ribosomal protein L15 [Elusimicrobia bacterium]|nr:50S ribosomal protein L15 [Elusimicrobiota bacterium]